MTSTNHRINIENVRVEVAVDNWLQGGVERQKKLAEDVVTQIKRHVDGITGATVVWDTRFLCEYCGYDLTDEPVRISDKEAIECCDEQIDAWRARHPIPEMFPGTLAALDALTVRGGE